MVDASAGRAGRPGRRYRPFPALARAGCGPLAGRLDPEETNSAVKPHLRSRGCRLVSGHRCIPSASRGVERQACPSRPRSGCSSRRVGLARRPGSGGAPQCPPGSRVLHWRQACSRGGVGCASGPSGGRRRRPVRRPGGRGLRWNSWCRWCVRRSREPRHARRLAGCGQFDHEEVGSVWGGAAAGLVELEAEAEFHKV